MISADLPSSTQMFKIYKLLYCVLVRYWRFFSKFLLMDFWLNAFLSLAHSLARSVFVISLGKTIITFVLSLPGKNLKNERKSKTIAVRAKRLTDSKSAPETKYWLRSQITSGQSHGLHCVCLPAYHRILSMNCSSWTGIGFHCDRRSWMIFVRLGIVREVIRMRNHPIHSIVFWTHNFLHQKMLEIQRRSSRF